MILDNKAVFITRSFFVPKYPPISIPRVREAAHHILYCHWTRAHQSAPRNHGKEFAVAIAFDSSEDTFKRYVLAK